MILDKSYIQGISAKQIHELAKSNKLYLCEAFLYEVLKADATVRSRIMKKFPIENGIPAYSILPNANLMLNYEIKYKKKASRNANDYLQERDYSIHSSLINEIEELSREHQSVLKERRAYVDNGTTALFFHIKNFHKLYGVLVQQAIEKGINIEEYIISREAMMLIGVTTKIIFDQEIKGDGKIERFPDFGELDSGWYSYRFMQVYNLISIDIIRRYTDLDIILSSSNSVEKLRHDFLDLEYLLWATTVNMFATKEKKLQRWFDLLTRL